MDIKDCLKERYLVKIEPAKDLIQKEIKESEYDLMKAKKAFSDKDNKWAIVKAYYSMFHSARAVLFKLGFKEKRHFAVGIVLEVLNKKGLLEIKYINDFSAAMSSREDADYRYFYSEESAKHNLLIAEEFLRRMKKLLDNILEKNLK